ncbi:LysR family transcriptional regulator [Sporosarcina luteola]|uniref:LysR family transcriptional regulator n=1 Tax=Sporosarcina luteola TaxID=582850 RepID=A0A511Z4S0_9BACL|nr:LysR family transcriptional regulator [Sporosarcina luteola]GEN82447.1 LysR family transcriptional regulator [Sporosarcina luteola]
MDEKDLRLLLYLNQERNITKVAENMFMTQPALSYRLQQIEQSFKAKLFVRGRMGIRPTPKGAVLIDYASEILEKMNEAREALLQMNVEVKGTIKLGVASTFGQYIMPQLLQAFFNEFPEVNVHMVTGLSTDMARKIDNGDVNVALIRGHELWNDRRELICEESLYIVSKEPIDVLSLHDFTNIHYQMDTYLKQIVDRWWKEWFDSTRKSVMKVDNLETGKEMARLGLGYTILPGICLVGEKELCMQPLETMGGEKFKRQTFLHYREEDLEIAAINAFVGFVKRYKDKIPLR